MKNSIFCFLFSIPLSCGLFADDTFKKNKMLDEIDQIKNAFEIGYAPKAWKKDYCNWDLNNEIEKSKQSILAIPNIKTKDFQKIVRNFFRSTKDYHVGVRFYSTEGAYLPIQIRGADGRFFITYIDRSKLSFSVYPINLGDEVIMFNGRPMAEVVEELQKEEFGITNSATDKALTEIFLTQRQGMVGQDVPRGPVSIQLRQYDGQINSYQLIWTYIPEKIENDNLKIFNFWEPKKNPVVAHFNKPWMTPHFEPYHARLEKQVLKYVSDADEDDGEDNDDDDQGELNPHEIGAKESFIPNLGKIWWKNPGKAFHAYIFETEDRQLIGYLRIPNYEDFYFGNCSFSDLVFIPELKNILSEFQDRTDALVIDQINNPGGSVFYMYSIVSLLTDKSLSTPKHRMMISHADVSAAAQLSSLLEKVKNDSQALKIIQHLGGSPVTYQSAQFILEYCRFILSQWKTGKKLTDPFYLFGLDHINPNPDVRYTKPILLIINQLDFSCGDFFPAILQDNKRATIFGLQTAGAGGYVLPNKINSRFGIEGFRYTGSIAEREDKQPIENLGVTPDIVYELSVEDYQYGFLHYKEAILEALKGLFIKKNSKDRFAKTTEEQEKN